MSASLAGFQEVKEKLRKPAFWDNESLWPKVAGSLPGYRLSKFQPLMPPWVEQEVVANYLLTLAGTRMWLTR